MATINNFTLRIPASLMEDVKALATRDAMSVNQFLVQAVAEKVATSKAQSPHRPENGQLAEQATNTSQNSVAVERRWATI